MADIKFVSISTEEAMQIWAGGPDANGMMPETHISDGDGIPCRHCQQDVAKGEPYLILSYRPFDEAQPYAETGPIFLHAKSCKRYEESPETPDMFLKRDSYLLKGYYENDRIAYGTGKIVKSQDMAEYASELLDREDISYVHVRSALNNCYSCRIERA